MPVVRNRRNTLRLRHRTEPPLPPERQPPRTEQHMIELTNLTKRFGKKVAVDDVTLTIRPGVITGFVGPNGAGKSTTIRMFLGLDRPTNGKVRIDGHSFAGCRAPLRTVGALVDSKGAQAGRSAYNHLRVLARTNGIPQSRVDEVIEIVGLTEVANQRVGSFSMGMGPTGRHRGRAAGRPADRDPRRAGQRPRPRGNPVDPQPDEGAGPGRQDGVRLLPPDE